MKKIYSLMLLCAAIVFATGCSKDDDSTSTPVSVSGVTLDKTTLSIDVGGTSTLIATVSPDNAADKSVAWSSDKTDIATVTDAGVVAGVAVGTATITVTSADGEKVATCQVTVTAATIAVISITLDGDKSISVGEKATPVATILPTNATNKTVTWSSSNTAVATINATTGEVTAIAKGETTITATSTSNPTVTATCKVKVEEKPSDYIEVNGIKVAIGNLVADGANGAKIGTATDGGLFFQFGSLIGWSTEEPLTIVVRPNGFNGKEGWAETGKIWQSATDNVPFTVKDSGSDNEKAGIGDPCRYYLGDPWRLPTKDEYATLFNNTTTNWAGSGGWSWNSASKSATHTDGSAFPASGFRSYDYGLLLSVGMGGCYWSASPYDIHGYYLAFYSFTVKPSYDDARSFGFSVRCVK